MSLVFRSQRRDYVGATAAQLIPDRALGMVGSVAVTSDSALRSSAVWACLRLRADLISTMPVDVFRNVNGIAVEVAKPPLLVNPGGERVHITEWLYSTQFDLDRCGNAFGIITQRDANGNPARIDLVAAGDVTVRGKGAEVTGYRIGSMEYAPRDIWHERQFTAPGLGVGLSPVAYAAWSIGGYLSAQQFALDWFANSAGPGGHLKNNRAQEMSAQVADVIKRRFKTATANRDVFVSGSEWEYTPVPADASQAAFLDQMKFGISDVCRFFGVPGDMIDAETSTASITYANVTQRNLQLLVMNLGPAIIRREAALSSALPKPRFVKFNTDAILRMDPSAVTANIVAQTNAGLRTIDEGRALLNLPPLPASATPTSEPAQVQASARAEAPVTHLHLPAVSMAAPQVTLHQEPAVVNVEAPIQRDVVIPAPVVQVTNVVEPTPVQVSNAVEPAAVFVEVAPTEVRVDAPDVTVNVETPPRKSQTTVKRDPRTGLITETTTTEKDA